MWRCCVFITLTLSMVIYLAPASAQWAWRDKSRGNQITFSDRPPPGEVNDSDIIRRPNQAGGNPYVASTPSSGDAENSQTAPPPQTPMTSPVLEAKRQEALKKAQAKEKSKEEENAKARQENCAKARSNQALLESGVRIMTQDENDEPMHMDDAKRSQELKKTRELLASQCD